MEGWVNGADRQDRHLSVASQGPYGGPPPGAAAPAAYTRVTARGGTPLVVSQARRAYDRDATPAHPILVAAMASLPVPRDSREGSRETLSPASPQGIQACLREAGTKVAR